MTTTTDTANPSSLCADCNLNPPKNTIRRRPLCPPCLQRFISSKILKRLDSSRPRAQQTPSKPRLLVPLSGGVSSATLLAVLIAHIRRQSGKTGRTGYEVVACRVDMGDEDGDGNANEWRGSVSREFPECEFVPVIRLSDVFTLDATLPHDLALLGVQRLPNEDNPTLLTRLATSARSATVRGELHELLLKRLVVATAKQHGCEAIMWGHSDTKLAATTLSLVAKGRGGNVAGEYGDGAVLWGVRFTYPCRDLFKGELEMYLESLGEGSKGCLLEGEDAGGGGGDGGDGPVVNLKGMSIDGLLGMYIGREGEKYPGIMANVVRTAGKLVAPEVAEGRRCRLCAGQVDGQSDGEKALCYGCERMKQDIKT